MKFMRTEIPDIVVIEPEIYGDERGYFMETFRQDIFESFVGLKIDFCQDNESKSSRGVLRGLHYQLPPAAQSKLVRVIRGRVLDVTVDIRRGSPTFGQYVSMELSSENRRQLFIPRGFAHGFVVLEDDTIFSYKVDSYYSSGSERGIAYDDPDIRIDWGFGTNELQLSEKDTRQPRLANAELFEYGADYYA